VKQEIISPQKTRIPHGILETHVTPLHGLWNTRVPWNPCWRILSKIIFIHAHGNLFWRTQIQLHIC